MFKYKNYIKSIKEGLIKTHNILKHHTSLEINLKGIGFDIEIEVLNKFQYIIDIKNVDLLKNDELFNLFFNINFNYGYYPCYYWVSNLKNMNNSYIFDIDELKKHLSNYSKLKIKFEAKYEDGLYKNTLEIPNLLYHLSPIKNKKSIEYNGLYPKSGSRKTYHPDRIYLFYDIENRDDILRKLKANDLKNGLDCQLPNI